MSERELRSRIAKRLKKSGAIVSVDSVDALATYVELLARWNTKINLTALSLDPPNEDAIDRLITEPILASRLVLPSDRLVMDVGSGGGSPAIPMQIAHPGLKVVMVESKVRKSAFLREVVRQLGLGAEVENCRFEELLSKPSLHESVDLVTMRAVRLEIKLLRSTTAFLRSAGRVMLFRSSSTSPIQLDGVPELLQSQREILIPSIGSTVDILKKRA